MEAEALGGAVEASASKDPPERLVRDVRRGEGLGDLSPERLGLRADPAAELASARDARRAGCLVEDGSHVEGL
jgi:hypothetical protein